jgi:hypothetical protein
MTAHRIEIVVVGPGVYAMTHRSEALGVSRSPFCDGARLLLARGVAERSDRIEVARRGVVAMTASVGWAAEHVASEGDGRSPRWMKWRPHPKAVSRGGVQAPAGAWGLAAVGHRPEETPVLAARRHQKCIQENQMILVRV